MPTANLVATADPGSRSSNFTANLVPTADLVPTPAPEPAPIVSPEPTRAAAAAPAAIDGDRATPLAEARDLFATEPASSGGRWKVAVALGVVLVLLAVAAGPIARQFRTAPAAVPTGTLVVTTPHPGTTVVLDGRGLGTTPLSATVTAGPHTLELLSAGIVKTVPLTITGGARVEQYIEMPAAAPTAAPPASPTVAAAPPADRATAAPGTTAPGTPGPLPASASVPAPPPPAAGWLAVQSPIELVVESDGRSIGSSGTGRLALPPGTHELTLRNDSLGYRTTRTVTVTSGRSASVVVEVPNGLAAVNALPWAEVWIDGARVGETPIGNFSLPIGTHEVVLRHPDHGEQRHTVTVTTAAVARLSADLR